MTAVARPLARRKARSLPSRRALQRGLLIYGGVLLFVGFAIFPVVWMAITAIKADNDLYREGNIPFWFNSPPTLDHVRYLFDKTLFLTWVRNSAEIAVLVVLITLVAAIPAGYALARLRFPASGTLGIVIFAATLSLQEFLYALTFVSGSDQKPVPLGVATDLVRGDIFYWGSLMSGALVVGVPVAILYSFFLDQFVTGITGGATK